MCDHTFYSSKYTLVTPYNPERVNETVPVQVCHKCGALRIGIDDIEVMINNEGM